MRTCELRTLRLVTYENGMAMQETLVGMRQRDEIPDQLLLLEHTPVITLGRGGDRANLLATDAMLRAAGVRFYETTRGGDITYHGPGQLVGYPLLHLGEGRRDVRKYVTMLEETLIRTVADFGIRATRSEVNRGIWAGDEKLGAIGIRIARWVTSHGFALNIDPDMSHFQLITPCGLQSSGVTSMRRLGSRATRPEIEERLVHHFAEVLEREIRLPVPPLQVAKVVAHDGDRILLLCRAGSAPFWQPVTGGVEPGETVEEAARRELFEETGYRAELVDLDLDQSFLIDPSFTAEGRAVFADEKAFAAAVDSSQPFRIDAAEHSEARWVPFDEASEMLRWSDDRMAVEKCRMQNAECEK
jgi:lipoyl(octanoyl) transferase